LIISEFKKVIFFLYQLRLFIMVRTFSFYQITFGFESFTTYAVQTTVFLFVDVTGGGATAPDFLSGQFMRGVGGTNEVVER
jgi:hypothetical protein